MENGVILEDGAGLRAFIDYGEKESKAICMDKTPSRPYTVAP